MEPSAALIDSLLRRYRARPLTRQGELYPALLLDRTPLQLDPDGPEQTLVAPLVWTTPDSSQLMIDDSTLLDRLLAEGRTVSPGLGYRMVRVSGRGPSLKVHCQLGRYDLMLRSSEALREEASLVTVRSFGFDRPGLLPLRDKLHSLVADPLRDGSGRQASLACSVLVAAADPQGGYRLCLHRRSQSVATYSGLLHVAPGFMLSPAQAGNTGSLSLPGQVLREYAEELFGCKEEQDAETHPATIELRALLAAGQAELWRTGLAVDLWNLRPELLCLLLIKDPGWLGRSSFREGFEVAFDGGPFARPPIRSGWSDSRVALHYPVTPSGIVPTGAAAFWLGLDQLRKLRGHHADEQSPSAAGPTSVVRGSTGRSRAGRS